jgi:hypothetical protein
MRMGRLTVPVCRQDLHRFAKLDDYFGIGGMNA